MKLCKDCKHLKPGEKEYQAVCQHPNNMVVSYKDLVFGEKSIWYRQTPAQLRDGQWLESVLDGKCGEKARWFSQRPIECEITMEDGQITLRQVE